MTSPKNCLFFGPYLLVYFETNPLHNIDCGHLNLNLTSPCPLIKFFCQNSKLVGLKSTFLRRSNKKKKKEEE